MTHVFVDTNAGAPLRFLDRSTDSGNPTWMFRPAEPIDTGMYASPMGGLDGALSAMARMVHCVKFGRELPGLDELPFPGELGQRIYDNVSAEGYALWQPHMTILINHYGLNPADPESRRILRDQMEEFFFGEDAQMPEGWLPPGAAGGKGGGAPARKK